MVDVEVNHVFAAAFLGHLLVKNKDCIFLKIGKPSILPKNGRIEG